MPESKLTTWLFAGAVVVLEVLLFSLVSQFNPDIGYVALCSVAVMAAVGIFGPTLLESSIDMSSVLLVVWVITFLMALALVGIGIAMMLWGGSAPSAIRLGPLNMTTNSVGVVSILSGSVVAIRYVARILATVRARKSEK